MTKTLNQRVTLTSVRFTEQFDIIPQRIEFDGISYDLTGEPKTAGDDTATIEVSDGTRLFRLLRGITVSDWRILSVTL